VPEPHLPSLHWLLLTVQKAAHGPLLAAFEPPQRQRARQGVRQTSLLEQQLRLCWRRPPLAAACWHRRPGAAVFFARSAAGWRRAERSLSACAAAAECSAVSNNLIPDGQHHSYCFVHHRVLMQVPQKNIKASNSNLRAVVSAAQIDHRLAQSSGSRPAQARHRWSAAGADGPQKCAAEPVTARPAAPPAYPGRHAELQTRLLLVAQPARRYRWPPPTACCTRRHTIARQLCSSALTH
jgi:hypothetical protein